jgi:hypothetical protein
MSKKHFSWLLIVSVLVAAVAILLPGRTAKEEITEKTMLLPGLQEQVNDIDWLRIAGAGNEVLATLRREGDEWVVEEAAAYRADWSRLKPLLSGLASARIVEAKTSNPDYYDRLGVEDISAPGAGGYRVEFNAESGIPAVIIGQRAQGRKGQYARVDGSAQSVLVDQQFEFPRDSQGWLDREIIDIGEAEVVEIGIYHADGNTVVARKASADDRNFELEAVPEGFEPRSEWSVNSLAGNLTALNLDAVAPAADIDWAGASRFRLLTADGLSTDAELVAVPAAEEGESEYWLRLQSSVYTTAVGSGVDDEADRETVSERAATINQKVSGRAYRIPKYKYDSMVKRMDDLVQAVEPAAEET